MDRKRILIVDDEKLICTALTKELEEEGYEVESALSGEDALRMVQDRFFDLVFVDLVMPGIDGMQTCKYIKMFSPDTELVCFTGTHDELTVQRQIDFIAAGGRVYFLYKPFKEGYIKRTAQKALSAKQCL